MIRLIVQLFICGTADCPRRTFAEPERHPPRPPPFAGAMMGRQVHGAIAVGRRVLLFAVVDVAGHPWLEGQTVTDAAWPADRRHDLAMVPREGSVPGPGLVWQPHPGYVFKPEGRVVLAGTRRGLAELLGRTGAFALRFCRAAAARPHPGGGRAEFGSTCAGGRLLP